MNLSGVFILISISILRLQLPGHEISDGLADVFAFVEHGVGFVNDGGDDGVFAGELPGGAGGGIAFGDGLHAGGDGGGLFAAADALAKAAVPAVAREAGDHEVAQAAEAGEGVGLRAASGAESADFGDGSGDEGGFGVVAEAEAVAELWRAGPACLCGGWRGRGMVG